MENKTVIIPKPSLSRLCRIFNLTEELLTKDISSISSKEIGNTLDAGPHTIRKDISYLGESGTAGSGYDVFLLNKMIREILGFDIVRYTCVIGLDSMGTAIIRQKRLFDDRFKIVAGFDYSINRLETSKTDIPLFPTYSITDTVKEKKIEFAIITDPGNKPSIITERLTEGGVKGIINLSSATLTSPLKGVHIRNVDLIGELRYLVALLTIDSESKIFYRAEK